MPSPWVALLRNVPWIDVIRNAAAVADGARRLWSSVRRQQPPAESGGVLAELATGADSPGLASVHARLAAADGALAALQEEMLASSELIRNLAEQNGQLVARIDGMRRRLMWLGAAAAASGVLGLVALMLALNR